MGEITKIEWCDHTFNPWLGCTKVSPACDHCYAESWAKRSGQPELWQGQRRRTTDQNWRQPYKWDTAAALKGERHRVFCASLADVFDNQVPTAWRCDLFKLIDATPNLDWLLLTKRPQNIQQMLVDVGAIFLRPNLWLGVTGETQEHFRDRWRHLREIPAVVYFISYEPALGPLHLFRDRNPDWIIAGGESGPHARMMDPQWARDLRDECASNGVSFFLKQMTSRAPIPADLLVRHLPIPRGAMISIDARRERFNDEW